MKVIHVSRRMGWHNAGMDDDTIRRPLIARRNFWLFVVAIYVLMGMLWAATFGIHSMELRDSRVRVYDHVFHNVAGADFNGQELALCVEGRQMHHRDEPAGESRYTVMVPVLDLWEDTERLEREGFFRPSWGKHNVGVPLRQVSPSCEHARGDFSSLPVVALPETREIGDYFDGYNRRELDRLIAKRSVVDEIMVIPQSHNAVSYSPHRQVVFVHTEPDHYGNRYIVIDVRGQKKERQISRREVFGAVLVDALMFPYQIYVWASYASAH